MPFLDELVVDYQTTLPIAQKWGGGEVASADGMRFFTPIRTINSGFRNDGTLKM
jgi:TnpA family transposase